MSDVATPGLITTGQICKRLGFQVTASFLEDVLMVEPAGRERNGVLWREVDLPLMASLLSEHVLSSLGRES